MSKDKKPRRTKPREVKDGPEVEVCKHMSRQALADAAREAVALDGDFVEYY